MTQERRDELLKGIAEAFEEIRPPMDTNFLHENRITADECVALSNLAGVILKGFVYSSDDTQNIILALGCLPGEVPEELGLAIEDRFHMERVKRELGG